MAVQPTLSVGLRAYHGSKVFHYLTRETMFPSGMPQDPKRICLSPQTMPVPVGCTKCT